jgi:hypothetical protein
MRAWAVTMMSTALTDEQEGLRRDTCDPVAPLLHRQSVLLLVRGKESTIKGMP